MARPSRTVAVAAMLIALFGAPRVAAQEQTPSADAADAATQPSIVDWIDAAASAIQAGAVVVAGVWA